MLEPRLSASPYEATPRAAGLRGRGPRLRARPLFLLLALFALVRGGDGFEGQSGVVTEYVGQTLQGTAAVARLT